MEALTVVPAVMADQVEPAVTAGMAATRIGGFSPVTVAQEKGARVAWEE